MRINELVAKARETLGAHTVYTQPYEQDGITVITAASIVGGAGGGNGHDKQGNDGEGGGFGVRARPTGAYLIKDGTVRWKPAIDVNRLLITVGLVVVATLVAAARVVKVSSRVAAVRTDQVGTGAIADGRTDHQDEHSPVAGHQDRQIPVQTDAGRPGQGPDHS